MNGFGRFLRVILWISVALALIWFAVSNRTPVIVGFSWTPWILETKLYVVFFAGLFTGLLIAGAVTGWLRLKSFTARRQAERRAKSLEADMDALHEEAHAVRAESARTVAVERVDGGGA